MPRDSKKLRPSKKGGNGMMAGNVSGHGTGRRSTSATVGSLKDLDIDEGWVPIASKIMEILEESLGRLAGDIVVETAAPSTGDKVRSRSPSREELIHNNGRPIRGTVVNVREVNGKIVCDVVWDPVGFNGRRIDDEETPDQEESIELSVPATRLTVSR